jgi:hypothetical protein
MPDTTTTTVYGSYGELTVCRSTGLVLAYEPDGDGREYDDIFRFDVATAPKHEGGDPNRLDPVGYDVVRIGFWTVTGEYVEQNDAYPDDV